MSVISTRLVFDCCDSDVCSCARTRRVYVLESCYLVPLVDCSEVLMQTKVKSQYCISEMNRKTFVGHILKLYKSETCNGPRCVRIPFRQIFGNIHNILL